MSSAISVNNLTKGYKNFHLEIENLEIEEGMVTGFIGENGAGKTTTINLILAMSKRDSGEISIFGDKTVPLKSEVKNDIGYVGDNNIFYPEFKLKHIVTSIAPFYNNFDHVAFDNLSKKFSIDLNKKYKALSKGQKQLFALIMALSHKPKLMILDEPTSGLDPAARADILEILANEVAERGMSIFFSTHITSDLESVADKIVFIHKGKIIMDVSKDELLEQYIVVKGYNKLLGDECKDIFCNLHKTEFSFEGLTNKIELAKAYFGNEAIYEKPSIENIFVSLVRSER